TDPPLRDAGEFTAVDAEVITAGTVAVYDFISFNRSIRKRGAYHPEHQFIAVINLRCCGFRQDERDVQHSVIQHYAETAAGSQYLVISCVLQGFPPRIQLGQ